MPTNTILKPREMMRCLRCLCGADVTNYSHYGFLLLFCKVDENTIN